MRLWTREPPRDFAEVLEAIPPELRQVTEAVLMYLQNDAKVPPKKICLTARICADLRVCEEDLDDAVVDLARRLGRRLPSRAEMDGTPPVITVQDLVAFLGNMKEAERRSQ